MWRQIWYCSGHKYFTFVIMLLYSHGRFKGLHGITTVVHMDALILTLSYLPFVSTFLMEK